MSDSFEFHVQISRIRIVNGGLAPRGNTAGNYEPKLVAHVSGNYNCSNKYRTFKSEEQTVYEGVTFILPCYLKNESLELKFIEIMFYQIDGQLSIFLGSSKFEFSDGFVPIDGPSSAIIAVISPGNSRRIGTVHCHFSTLDVFDENHGANRIQHHPEAEALNQIPIPNFRFQRLSKCINWERIRMLSVERALKTSDPRGLLSCIDDISRGDTSQEQIDPALRTALHVLQYGSQYLQSSSAFLKEKGGKIRTALKTFEHEEELLELRLCKLKAREKALSRESADLDRISLQYASTLQSLQGHMVDNLYKVYKRKVVERDKDIKAERTESSIKTTGKEKAELRVKQQRPRSVASGKDRREDRQHDREGTALLRDHSSQAKDSSTREGSSPESENASIREVVSSGFAPSLASQRPAVKHNAERADLPLKVRVSKSNGKYQLKDLVQPEDSGSLSSQEMGRRRSMASSWVSAAPSNRQSVGSLMSILSTTAMSEDSLARRPAGFKGDSEDEDEVDERERDRDRGKDVFGSSRRSIPPSNFTSSEGFRLYPLTEGDGEDNEGAKARIDIARTFPPANQLAITTDLTPMDTSGEGSRAGPNTSAFSAPEMDRKDSKISEPREASWKEKSQRARLTGELTIPEGDLSDLVIVERGEGEGGDAEESAGLELSQSHLSELDLQYIPSSTAGRLSGRGSKRSSTSPETLGAGLSQSSSMTGSNFGNLRDEQEDDLVLFGTAKMSGSMGMSGRVTATNRLALGTDSMRSPGAPSECVDVLSPLGELALHSFEEGEGPEQLSYDSVLSSSPAKVAGAGGGPAAKWQEGRASVELIELAESLEVHVSSFRFEGVGEREWGGQLCFRVEYVGLVSPTSPPVSLSHYVLVHPVGFFVHLKVDRSPMLFAEWVKGRGDGTAVHLELLRLSKNEDRDSSTTALEESLGKATLSMEVMVEDSCHIIRREVEMTNNRGALVGTAMVDIRGFRFLQNIFSLTRKRG